MEVQVSAEISRSIQGVSDAAENTSRGANDTHEAAQELVRMSTQLRGLIDQFKISEGEDEPAAVTPEARAASSSG